MPVIAASYAGKTATLARRFTPWISWQGLGAALLGILLAKWTWALVAPASPALPPSAWDASEDAGRLFGTARGANAQGATPLGNLKLVGVSAHRTSGFAVMLIDDKQLGVAQGEEVRPGIRLVETHADHVVLEQGGVRQRVELMAAPAAPTGGASAPYGAAAVPHGGMAAPATAPAYAAAPPGAQPAQQQAVNDAPPERREMLKGQLEQMRGQH